MRWMRAFVVIAAPIPWAVWAAEGAGGAAAVPVDTVSYAFKTLLALGLVVGLVLLSAWVLRRLQGLAPGGGGRLKVVAALPLGARERLVVVEVGGEQLLIGVAPGQVRALHVLREPIEVAAPPSAFPERLRQALRRREEGGDGA